MTGWIYRRTPEGDPDLAEEAAKISVADLHESMDVIPGRMALSTRPCARSIAANEVAPSSESAPSFCSPLGLPKRLSSRRDKVLGRFCYSAERTLSRS
jgi:hypothetical protein